MENFILKTSADIKQINMQYYQACSQQKYEVIAR